MDFLSKINANAGIDVKKGQFIAENATVKNFEVSGTAINQTVTTINSGKATFNNSEFAVAAGHGVTIVTDNAELNMHDSELSIFAPIPVENDPATTQARVNHIIISTEFFSIQSGSNLSLSSLNAFNINSKNITMLAEHSTNDGNVIGGEFEVSSYTNNINSASYINMGAEVDGSGLGASIRISSYLDEENTTPNNGSLVKINGSAVKIDSTEYLVNAYANLKFTGGSVEIDTTEYLINNAEKFSVDTSEFLVNNFGSFKLNGDLTSRFIFTGFGIEINTTEFLVNSSGITFNTNNDSVWSYHSIDSCAKNLCIKAPETRFDDTNGVFIAFKDSGGNMTFTRNGINVNTTPEGATSAISGNALLSQSLRSIERMTQSEYDAIETKDENTLYIIAG